MLLQGVSTILADKRTLSAAVVKHLVSSSVKGGPSTKMNSTVIFLDVLELVLVEYKGKHLAMVHAQAKTSFLSQTT